MAGIYNNKNLVQSRIISVIVGLIFLISAFGKIGDVGGFAELIVKYGLPLFSILAPFIVAVELLIGLCLVFGICQRVMSLFTAGVLILFTGVFAYGNIFSGIEDCGCFGALGIGAPAWTTYVRNAILLALSVWIWLKTPQKQNVVERYKWMGLAMLMIGGAFVIGLTFKTPSYDANKFARPHPLVGKPISETKFSNFVHTDYDSTYVLYMFSYDCSTCIDGLNNVKEYNDPQIADHFYGLPVSEDSDSIIHRQFNVSFDEIFVGTGLQGQIESIPVLLYIEHDSIKYLIQGSVPSAYHFKTMYLDAE